MNARIKRLLSYLTILRPEEYLTILFFIGFSILDHLGITKLRLDTNFIKASVSLFMVFTVLYLIVVAIRNMLGKNDNPLVEKIVIGTAIAIPLGIFLLVATKIIPEQAFPIVIRTGWGVLGVSVFIGSILVLRKQSDRGPAAVLKLLGRLVSDAFNFARDWVPFIILLAMYENTLYLVVKINHHLYDPYIFHLDKLMFGGHLDLWLQKFISPPLTEWMSFTYDVLYFYPVVIGMILYFQRRNRHFRNFMMAFIMAGWFGFIGYTFFPVIGPNNYYSNVYTVSLNARNGADVLEAAHTMDQDRDMTFLKIARMINDKQSYAGYIPRNCFPSMHTAWAVVAMVYSFLYLPLLFIVIIIPLLSLVLATIYLRFHYMSDVLGGVMVAVFTITVIPRLDAWWQRHQPPDLPGRLPPDEPLPRSVENARYPWTRAIMRLRRMWDRLGKIRVVAGVGLPLLYFAFVGLYIATADVGKTNERAKATIVAQYSNQSMPHLPEKAWIRANFGHKIELLGAVPDERPTAGKAFKLNLYWKKLAPLRRKWKVFVHVEFSGGLPRMNLDHYPVFGLYPIRKWKTGEIVKDCLIVTIPKEYKGHAMKIWVGLFNEDFDSQRLPVTNPKSVPNDGHNRVLVLSADRL